MLIASLGTAQLTTSITQIHIPVGHTDRPQLDQCLINSFWTNAYHASQTLQELREELKGRGLSASGVKADLVKRLEESLGQTEEEGATPTEEQPKVLPAFPDPCGRIEPATNLQSIRSERHKFKSFWGFLKLGLQEGGVEPTEVTVEVEADVAPAVLEAAATAATEAADKVIRDTPPGEAPAAEQPKPEEVHPSACPAIETPDPRRLCGRIALPKSRAAAWHKSSEMKPEMLTCSKVAKGTTNVQAAATEEAAPAAAAATEEAAPAAAEANGDAKAEDAAPEGEAAQPMDTVEDGAPAAVKGEEETEVKADTTMEDVSAEAQAEEGGGPPVHRLFVGCIPPKLVEDDLKAHFEEVGAQTCQAHCPKPCI